MKIINKYDTYKANYGGATENKKPSLTNKTRAAQTEVKNIVEMYGMDGLTCKWQASEPFYADMTEAVTVQNALELRQKANDYFAAMPAKARKVFGDNPDLFYERYKQGDFEGFIETGAMTEELVDYYEKKFRDMRGNYEQVQQDYGNNTVNYEKKFRDMRGNYEQVQQDYGNNTVNSKVNTNNAEINSTTGTNNQASNR